MMYKTNGGDVLKYPNIFLSLILLMSTQSLYANSLKAAQEELSLSNSKPKVGETPQNLRFSTVEIKESFLEEAQVKNHSLIFGYSRNPLANGLLQETGEKTQFPDMNTVYFSYASGISSQLRWYVESAYGLSQGQTDFYSTETEKLNFNRFLLGSGLEYRFYSNKFFSLSTRAGLEQNYLLQVSESGLKDKRKNLGLAKLGLGIYSKSFYQNALRFRLLLSNSFGADFSEFLIGRNSVQIELEMRL